MLNFESASEKDIFCTFTFNDFIQIIESHKLVTSTEDIVLETVMKWIDKAPVELCKCDSMFDVLCADKKEIKLDALKKLLKSVRLALVSLPVLEHAQQHQFVKGNLELEQIILKAIPDKTAHAYHGQWRNSALHRACSDFEQCGITLDKNNDFIIIFCRFRHECLRYWV